MKRDYVNERDWEPGEIAGLLDLAARVKSDPGHFRQALAGKTLAMVFEKSSTRTRVSFEAGMFQLGGLAMFLSARDLQLGRGETVADTARVLSRYADGIMARTFAHATVEELARYASVPVINGLSDLLHPCQALADFLTLQELHRDLRKVKLCYVGDGNNVSHSLLFAAAKCGASLTVACPEGYEPLKEVVELAREDAKQTSATLRVVHDPMEGVRGANAVYTGALHSTLAVLCLLLARWKNVGTHGANESRDLGPLGRWPSTALRARRLAGTQ